MSILDINSKDYDFSNPTVHTLGSVDISNKSYNMVYKISNDYTGTFTYEYAKHCPEDNHLIYLNPDDVLHYPVPNYDCILVSMKNSWQRVKYKTGKKKKDFKINPNVARCVCGSITHKTHTSKCCILNPNNIKKIFHEFNIDPEWFNYKQFYQDFNDTNDTSVLTKTYLQSSPDYGDELIETISFLLNVSKYRETPTVAILRQKLIESLNSNEERINEVKEEMAEQHNICLFQQSYINRVKNAMFLDKHFPDKKMNCDICCEEKEFCKQYIPECKCNVTVCSKCSDEIRKTNEGQYKCPMCRNQEI
jgi:hypothetical protein